MVVRLCTDSGVVLWRVVVVRVCTDRAFGNCCFCSCGCCCCCRWQNQSPFSVWHHALHEFQEHFDGGEHPVPVLHVDIHGKMDRKDNLDLDIGPLALSSLRRRALPCSCALCLVLVHVLCLVALPLEA